MDAQDQQQPTGQVHPQQGGQPYFAPPPTNPGAESTSNAAQQPYFPPPPPAGSDAQPSNVPQSNYCGAESSSNATQQPYFPPPPANPAASSGSGPAPYQPTPPDSSYQPTSQQQYQPSSDTSAPAASAQQFPPAAPGSGASPASQKQFPPPPPLASHTSQAPPPLPIRPETYGPPPQRQNAEYGENISSPIHYTRDPHKLVAYLVQFPAPTFKSTEAKPPPRFLIYTPPPPPMRPLAEGEKEGRIQHVQRKWQNEVREAKTGNAKVASWKGVKGRVTKGVDWAMGQTKSSNLEFLNRIPGASGGTSHDAHADDGHSEGDTTHKTVGLEEMVLIYPSTMPVTQEELRQEFVNSMMRSKSKAQKDAVLATGLIPVSLAIDILATFIWPFGGLAEIDTVWAAASIRGAKTSRSVTKRLNSTGSDSNTQLKLTFLPSPRLDVLASYLGAECHRRDGQLFRSVGAAPTESQAIEAIGWSPSQNGGATSNWEDEKFELQECKDDLKQMMHKGAREWDKWCKTFEQDPQKAMKK